jgi:DNA-binding NarL/FixJ family response regulator
MIRVFIIAQSLVTQAGLIALLSTDLEIVGSAICPDSIPLSVSDSDAAVILLEQDAMSIKRSEVEIPIVLSLEDSSMIADFLRSGIRSVLPSDVARDQLIEAIKATSAGLTVLHPDLVEALFLPTLRSSEPAPLTPREAEVLRMLAEGLGNRTIAQQLNLSEHFV